MIGKLKGIISYIQDNEALIDTESGVSYYVYLTPNSQKPLNSPIEVLTYLQVRDDAFVLFGFSDRDQLLFFKMLLTVPGVGPKTAFSILSHTKVAELLAAVRENDTTYFTRIPGLGKKTALKIILELSQKIKSEFKMQTGELSEDDTTAVAALVSLGFPANEARKLVSKMPTGITVEEKIKQALKKTHK